MKYKNLIYIVFLIWILSITNICLANNNIPSTDVTGTIDISPNNDNKIKLSFTYNDNNFSFKIPATISLLNQIKNATPQNKYYSEYDGTKYHVVCKIIDNEAIIVDNIKIISIMPIKDSEVNYNLQMRIHGFLHQHRLLSALLPALIILFFLIIMFILIVKYEYNN